MYQAFTCLELCFYELNSREMPPANVNFAQFHHIFLLLHCASLPFLFDFSPFVLWCVLSMEPVWMPWICGSSLLSMKQHLKTEWRSALYCWATGLTRPCSTATARALWTWRPLLSWRRDSHVSVVLHLNKLQLQSIAQLNVSRRWIND